MSAAQLTHAVQPPVFSTSPFVPLKHASAGLAKAAVLPPPGLEDVGFPPGLEPCKDDDSGTIGDNLWSRSTTGTSSSPTGSMGSTEGDGEHSDAPESDADLRSDPLSLLAPMQQTLTDAYGAYAYHEVSSRWKSVHPWAATYQAVNQGWHYSNMYANMQTPVLRVKRFCHDCGGKRDPGYTFCAHCGVRFDSPA